ncbi:ABC transporter permease [Bombiscardovia coagulans]|uniref:ABC-2 family transporter protein n=1 Tax=Bombiscardovia coagulans TaxID=686666 RepID=A0A261EQ12_9BIFI|nr:ABC transporter permease [Bombiscardovia coagulans]OZG48776.1 ABC-2 family transporter protein [Bombiscardovia coagulans]
MNTSTMTSMRPVQPHPYGVPVVSHADGPGVLLALEVRKLKGSSFWWMAFGMMFLVSAWAAFAFIKRDGSSSLAMRTITLAQGEVYQTFGLLAPILAALLTSRMVFIDSSERMDLKWRSLGQNETGQFLVKMAVAAVTLSMSFIIPLVWIPLVARAKGFVLNGDFTVVISAPVLTVFFASVAVTAIQLMLSLTVSKQAVGLGVGVIAGLIGTGLGPMNVTRLGWLFPAGISSAANPFLTTSGPDGYAKMTLVASPWIQVGASLFACVAWTAISLVIIKVKESHQ